MEKKVFINLAFDNAINDYLEGLKKPDGVVFNSFSVVVIRSLAFIYDELDILTPFYALNEDDFDKTLGKYNYPKNEIETFKNSFNNYMEKENSDGFIFIEKTLVDMFLAKIDKTLVTDDEINEFHKLLYSPYAKNPLMVAYNFKMNPGVSGISDYFEERIPKHGQKEFVKLEKLNLDAYKLLNYSLDDIENMTEEELNNVNREVYTHFKINPNGDNKKVLLDKAVLKEIKKQKRLQESGGHINIVFIVALILLGLVSLAFITIIIL